MAAYSFKKEARAYVVYQGLRYSLDISDIAFEQGFAEQNISKKTLHQQNYFDESLVYKANPATFSFTFPAIKESDLKVVFDRALDYNSFDLYVETNQDVFKVEYCVITSAVFIIQKGKALAMAVSGEASKLLRVGSYGYSIPGTPFIRTGSRNYNLINYVSITLAGDATLSQDLISLTTELQNNVSWTNNTVVQGACATDLVINYPTDYVVDKRILSGSITRYLTVANNTLLQTWNNNTTLYIEAGNQIGNVFTGFIFDVSKCSYTNRLTSGEIYTQSYDWRLTGNSENLNTTILYVVSETVLGAIQDSVNENILDSINNPILES